MASLFSGQAATSPVHPAAAAGYVGGAVDTYIQGRPEYPAELSTWLGEVAGIRAGSIVVDLGAGTGKFTRLLLALQAETIAVEPVADMLSRLVRDVPGAVGLQGSASSIPLPAASADVVVCAQAFHWFANTAALDEIVRVLRPGGRLVLVWNLRDAQVPWVQRMDRLVNAYEGDVPRFYKGSWRHAFPHAGLGVLQGWEFANAHVGAPEDVILKRVLSTSFISALPQAQRDQVRQDLLDLIADEPALRGRDVVPVPYRTFAFCALKLS
ncbi:class I SAM-dependent methyltransferase [Hydrogenophaga sp.]|uniref:class I SAM-dependent methyltransferase n=1 Tax=Hydrogenophaga sp. TaxID=1904254 RepID=UPI002628C7A2|nr:class I SAM-dependent methyltransferase [Hydrogenophaga sp.]MCW5653905.1 methyltransferase domain-containing protein [Hydrogenophaga sp.]